MRCGASRRRFLVFVVNVGEVEEAEYFLRRNLEVGASTHDAYLELFGTEKEDELNAAIDGFCRAFGVELRYVESRDYLHREFEVVRTSTSTEPRLGFIPAVIDFNYRRHKTR